MPERRSAWRLSRRLSASFLRMLGAGRGRPLAMFVLLLAALILPIRETTPLAALDNLLFDHLQRLLPRDRGAMPVLIVSIDEKSLATFGQWPWPRQIIARLLRRIGDGAPLAIGLDMLFPEADRNGPPSLARLYPQLRGLPLPDPDADLAQALATTPSVLGLIALPAQPPDLPHARLPRGTPLILHGHDKATAFLARQPAALTSLTPLAQAAQGEALLNAEFAQSAESSPDILRRLPFVAAVAGRPVASLSAEMLRLALAAPGLEIWSTPKRITTLGIGDYRLPCDADGSVRLHFGSLRADRYFSAADVLADRIPSENFRGRFVLVGFTGNGLHDHVLSPLGETLPGVEVHAQALESLLAGSALSRPDWMAPLEILLLAMLGGGLCFFLPRQTPLGGVASGFMAGGSLLLLSCVFFANDWLFAAPSCGVLLAPPFLILLGKRMQEVEGERRGAAQALAESRAVALRQAAEFDAARRIQMGMLPDPQQRFAGERRFSLALRLEPAQAVGGDYVDCFMLDTRRLALIVGDVSGKGLPASLFMAMAKVVSASVLPRHGADLGAALAEIDAALGRENREALFVTTCIVVLDTETGDFVHASAGHPPPWQLGAHTATPLAAAGGPPLCTLPGFAYRAGRARLSPGDSLLLLTDGICEAMHAADIFGTDRLAALLSAWQGEGDAEQLADALLAAVHVFEAEQPATDDRALLVLRWAGPA